MAASPIVRMTDDDNASRPLLSRIAPSKENLLSVSGSVVKQLPTGTVMTFQALSSSFTNQGKCHASNSWLSFVLVALLTLSCIFFWFTDSFVVEGKRRYGMVLPGGLKLFNLSAEEERTLHQYSPELRSLRLRCTDLVRAFFTATVLLAFVAGEVGIQKCFFPHADIDTKELLKNVPLLVALNSSAMFARFPTTRKGIDLLSPGGSTVRIGRVSTTGISL